MYRCAPRCSSPYSVSVRWIVVLCVLVCAPAEFLIQNPFAKPTDPPGAPFFEGYSQGETLHRGQEVQIACRSRGGNPPAQLTWYRNGVAISSPQRTSGRLSENVYKFTAAAEDNGANLVCEAKNLLATTPLRAELNLTVLCKFS